MFGGDDETGNPAALNTGTDSSLSSFGGPAGSAAQEAVDVEDPKKARPKRPKFDDTKLVKPEGLPGLAKMFAAGPKPRGRGHEAADAAQIMRTYQAWAERLAPWMAFEDFISRCEKQRNKQTVPRGLTYIF